MSLYTYTNMEGAWSQEFRRVEQNLMVTWFWGIFMCNSTALGPLESTYGYTMSTYGIYMVIQ